MAKKQTPELAQKQKCLVAEVEVIAELCVLDYEDTRDYSPADRTVRLELMIRQFVLSKVVSEYA